MSVQEIIRNKKYKIDVPIGYNGSKRIRHIETFYGGKKDAILRENELKIQLKDNTYIKKNKMLMSDLIDEWLKYKKTSVGVKTYKEYQRYCEHISKSMGHLKIKDINAKLLEDFYAELKVYNDGNKIQNGYAEKTIRHHYAILSSIFNTAIKWGYMFNNPNQNVTPIKVHKKEIQCYSAEDVATLIEVLENEPIKYQAIIMLALDSGCRRGEITGLKWTDVDFNNSTINVNKTTQYVAGYGVFEKETKSNTSNRIIYITPTTLRVLRKYKMEQDKQRMLIGSKWKNSGRVFVAEDGADMHPDTPSKILEKIIKKYGLKKISFHGLRHTSISLQINRGIQAQVISRRAGHSSVSVTHNIYSHFFNDEFKNVANELDSIFTKKETKEVAN